MNQKQPETKTVERQPDLLDRIIEETRDVGINVTPHGLEYTTFTGLCTLAKLIFEAGACPKSMDSSKKVLIAIAQGQTVGLNAFQSVQAFYIVNGAATLWGNAPLAICRQHPKWDESGFDEWFEVKGERIKGHPLKWDEDSITAVCQTLRKGASQPMQRRFSIADAKKAGLWTHTQKLYGPYPQRLLPARARGYNLNDNFGDSLKGIMIRETFDEEVDGKRLEVVNNADELREQLDRKKVFAENAEQSEKRKILSTVKKTGMSYNSGVGEEHFNEQVDRIKNVVIETKASSSSPDAGPVVLANNSSVISRAVKQSFPETRNEAAERSIREEASHVVFTDPPSDIEDARHWLRTVFDKIPIRMGSASMLKDASLRDGKWISYEQIENIDDVEYLNLIAANLEDALKAALAKAAKA